MPSLSSRMRKLHQTLLGIRLGPGALILPKEVKRIHMRFPARMEGGHMGPRKFWRSELVRLKYHNPAVLMTVDRSGMTPDDESTMSIHFAPPDAIQTSSSATSGPAPIESTTTTSQTSNHTPADRVETIGMKFRSNSDILQDLMRLTNAYPVEATPEDQEQLAALEEQKVRSDRDRVVSSAHTARVKREQQLLEQARGGLGA